MQIVCKCDRCKVKVDITQTETCPEGWVGFVWDSPDMLLPLKLCVKCSKAAKTFLTGGEL